jgi:hypothetical protein
MHAPFGFAEYAVEESHDLFLPPSQKAKAWTQRRKGAKKIKSRGEHLHDHEGLHFFSFAPLRLCVGF